MCILPQLEKQMRQAGARVVQDTQAGQRQPGMVAASRGGSAEESRVSRAARRWTEDGATQGTAWCAVASGT